MVYILTGNLAYFMLGQGERTMHMLKIDQTFKNIEKKCENSNNVQNYVAKQVTSSVCTLKAIEEFPVCCTIKTILIKLFFKTLSNNVSVLPEHIVVHDKILVRSHLTTK